MPERKDYTDQRFGRLVVQKMSWRHGYGYAQCLCDCGSTWEGMVRQLVTGQTSCGCAWHDPSKRRRDLTGQRFERLHVLSMTWRNGLGYAACLCDCGKTWEGLGTTLTSHHTRSCGCIVRTATPESRRQQGLLLRQRYLARKKGLPDTFAEVHLDFMMRYWQYACAICGREDSWWFRLACDHWIPLSSMACPGSVPGNMIPLCHGIKGKPLDLITCNHSKGRQLPEDWLRRRFGRRKVRTILQRIQAYFRAAEQCANDEMPSATLGVCG
jgi:hypothetical protein